MKKLLSLLIMGLMLIALTACGSTTEKGEGTGKSGSNESQSDSGEKIKLTYAFFTTENTFLGQMVQYWADEVEKRTNGKVDVEVYYGGTLLDATNMFDGVKSKVADIGLTVLQYEPGRYPLVEIGELPIGYPSGKVASQVAYDLIQEYPLESISDLKVVATFANDANHLFSNKPIQTVDDLKGKQFRVAGAYIPLIEKFGSAGVGMSQAQQAEALQTGVIDGMVTERALLKDAQLAELVDHLVDTPLYVSTFVAAMNMDTWNSLPKDVQQVIEEIQKELPAFAGDYLDARTQDAIDWAVQEHGLKVVKFSDEEQKKWDQAVAEYREDRIKILEAAGHPARDYANRAEELLEKYMNE